jgi:hypothetical protein
LQWPFEDIRRLVDAARAAPDNLLGRGGFGEVFKCELPHGESVAAKVSLSKLHLFTVFGMRLLCLPVDGMASGQSLMPFCLLNRNETLQVIQVEDQAADRSFQEEVLPFHGPCIAMPKGSDIHPKSYRLHVL